MPTHLSHRLRPPHNLCLDRLRAVPHQHGRDLGRLASTAGQWGPFNRLRIVRLGRTTLRQHQSAETKVHRTL